MSALDYAVGDGIYIFSDSSWGPGSFSAAIVVKISPAGQITTESHGMVRRFMPSGKEVGGSASKWRSGPWIEPKAKARERAAMIRRENAKSKLKNETRGELDLLRGLDVMHQKAELVTRLRALADKLEAEET